MPCYTAQTMSVSFKAQNIDLLLEALKNWQFRRVGQIIRINTTGGEIDIDLASETATLRGANTTVLQSELNALKRAYSMEAIKVMTKKQHWTLKIQSTNKMAGTLLRRN
jgi:hypothetical protein